jgi:8-oxo-dGTP pyrophosphatase MutT (NUDIX family)
MPHIHNEPGQVDHTVEVFIVCDGKILLRKHDKYKIWLSIGGHIELDEDPNQAALREVKEEVGLDITLYAAQPTPQFDEPNYKELIPPISMNRHAIGETHEHVCYVYFAQATTTDVTPENSDDEWKWFSVDELMANGYGIKASIQHSALAALKALGNS